jgi:diaminopimelate epimerase
MELPFTKMQGLGNDFVVLDGVTRPVEMDAALVRALADRRHGVGCDQVLLVEPSTRPEADYRYRIWNADGGEVEHCGNGIRCAARLLQQKGLADDAVVRFETAAGLARVELLEPPQVAVDMGPAVLEPAQIPFDAPARAPLYALDVAGSEYSIGAASMGNPHAVLPVTDLDHAPVAHLGPAIEAHPRFPARCNAGFMQIIDPGHIRLRVYERGVGETPACGTGACAAVVVGVLNDWLDTRVRVDLPGGALVINWAGDGHSVMMTGPAERVFEGSYLTDKA